MNTYFSRTLRFFIGFASIGLTVTFIKAYAYYFNAFFLALIIVLTVSPIMFWMRKHGFPNWLALIIALLITLAVTTLLTIVVALSVVRVGQLLPTLVGPIDGFIDAIDQVLARVDTSFADLVNLIEREDILQFSRRILDTVLQSVSLFFLTLLIIIFMSVEAFAFPYKVERQLQLGNPQFMSVYRFSDNIRQYVGITTLLGLIGGTLIAVLLLVFRLEFAVMWGVLYFVMNFVPVVGFWIALIPPVLLAFAQLGVGQGIAILLLYLVISTFINQVLKPTFLRGGLDLSPLWSIMSLIIWAAILGPPGLIVGVPLTIALKELVLAPDQHNSWIIDIISAGIPPENAAEVIDDT